MREFHLRSIGKVRTGLTLLLKREGIIERPWSPGQSRLDCLRRFTTSSPRNRESSGLKFGLIAPIYDASFPLDQDAGIYGGLDSRLRGNDGLLGGELG